MKLRAHPGGACFVYSARWCGVLVPLAVSGVRGSRRVSCGSMRAGIVCAVTGAAVGWGKLGDGPNVVAVTGAAVGRGNKLGGDRSSHATENQSVPSAAGHALRDRQLQRFKDGKAVLLNAHITHHAGTTMCSFAQHHVDGNAIRVLPQLGDWNEEFQEHRPKSFKNTARTIATACSSSSPLQSATSGMPARWNW